MHQHPFIDWHSSSFTTPASCTLLALRGPAQFHITAPLASVSSTPFGVQLFQLIERHDPWAPDPQRRGSDPAEMVYARCEKVIEELRPRRELEEGEMCLGAFVRAPTWELRVERLEEGEGEGDGVVVTRGECTFTPAFFIAPGCSKELSRWASAVPRFSADEVFIAPLECGESLDSVQGRVRTRGGEAMWFKPRMKLREPDFERELELLLQMRGAGLAARIRVPELLGLVVSKSGLGAGDRGKEEVIGLLMTMINSSEKGRHLEFPAFHGMSEMHKRWEDQVVYIVRELHAHGIVWGDVNPMNVVIDQNLNAWVIDYGGMNNVQFVDDKNRETKEGDWQGIRRLFGEWLPRQAGNGEGV